MGKGEDLQETMLKQIENDMVKIYEDEKANGIEKLLRSSMRDKEAPTIDTLLQSIKESLNELEKLGCKKERPINYSLERTVS